MDGIELIKAALYGLVEGICEWLPLSSEAHMLLLRHAISLHISAGLRDLFLLVLQFSAALAVLVLYGHRLNPLTRDKGPKRRRGAWRLLGKMALGCLPLVVVATLFGSWITEHFTNPLIMAIALIVYGIALIAIEAIRAKTAVAPEPLPARPAPRHMSESSSASFEHNTDDTARVRRMIDLDVPTVLGIGVGMVLSLIPGTSLVASALIAGLVLGCSRRVAVRFSLFLAMPYLLVSSAWQLFQFFVTGTVLSFEGISLLLIGGLAAFGVSYFVVPQFMHFVRKHTLLPFGWYRMMLGFVIIMCSIALW